MKSTTSYIAMRHKTHEVSIENEGRVVTLGGTAPILVQSMTNTATEDIDASVAQVLALAKAGSELVRLTVNTPQAARAIPTIREKLNKAGCFTPLVGDFHYNGHKLLTEEPACATALSKYRINPGNVGKGDLHGRNFASMVELACRYEKAIRIGVNGGSVDKELLSAKIDANKATSNPKSDTDIFIEALIESTLQSARDAVALGLPEEKIVLSTKVSDVSALVTVYRALARESNFALHLGLTEAGIGSKGTVASSAALAILLAEGIGDTIRISVTPTLGEARTSEVRIARELLQSMGLRHFFPLVTSCPGCGRTSSDLFQRLAKETQEYLAAMGPEWAEKYPSSVGMRVAVMGCVVNGPGEASAANIGISLPGRGEAPVAPVFADGVKIGTLKGEALFTEFKTMIDEYVVTHYGK